MDKKLTELFTPYKEALELKELGFDNPCVAIYDFEKDIYYPKHNLLYTLDMLGDTPILAPLYQQAFRFFREKYGLEGTISSYDLSFEEYYFVIKRQKGKYKKAHEETESIKAGTYEEAELACLKKLIEIIKNK